MDFTTALEVLRAKKSKWVADGYTDDEFEAFTSLRGLPMADWPRCKKQESPEGVVIIGKASGEMVTPWMTEGWEFWGLNEQTTRYTGSPPLPNYDRWFQLHPPRYLKRHYPPGLDDLNDCWTCKQDVPVYMDRHYEEYPDSVAFPKAEVEALTSRGRYHASSIDWMLALAILEGFKRILVVGATMTTYPVMNGEPISARSCMEYWTGVAEGRGIEVGFAGPTGHLFQVLHMAVYESDRQYGFEDEPGLDLAEDTEWEDFR